MNLQGEKPIAFRPVLMHNVRERLRAKGLRINGALARGLEQGLWSMSSFLSAGVGAAVLSTRDFGALAIGSSAVVLIQALLRGLYGEPLAVAAANAPSQLNEVRRAALRHMKYVVPACIGIILAPTLLLIPAADHSLILGCAACSGAIAFADVNRTYRSIHSDFALSLLTGIAALAVQAIVTTSLYYLVSADASAFMWGWLAGLLVFGHSLPRQLPPRDASSARTTWRTTQRRNSPYFLAEATITAGASQGGAFLLAGAGGIESNAAARGAFLLLFPVNMVIQALTLVLVVTVAPHSRSRRGIVILIGFSLGLFISVCAYGLMVSQIPALPQFLLGETAASSLSVLRGPAICLAGTTFLLIPLATSRALNLPQVGVVARLILAPVTLLVPAILVRHYASDTGIDHGYAIIGLTMAAVGLFLFLFLWIRVQSCQVEISTGVVPSSITLPTRLDPDGTLHIANSSAIEGTNSKA